MSQTRKIVVNNPVGSIICFFFNIATAMIGHTIHHSIFWSIMDFFFSIFAWLKWLICQEVNMRIIRDTFGFFFN